MSALAQVIHNGTENHNAIYQNIPVHSGSTRVSLFGGKGQDEHHQQKSFRDDIDGETPSSQAESRRKEGLFGPPPISSTCTRVTGLSAGL